MTSASSEVEQISLTAPISQWLRDISELSPPEFTFLLSVAVIYVLLLPGCQLLFLLEIRSPPRLIPQIKYNRITPEKRELYLWKKTLR